MKMFIGILFITWASVDASGFSHEALVHHADVHHSDVHHLNGVGGALHFGKSSAIVIDGDHVTEHHPVYHHNAGHLDAAAVDIHHGHNVDHVATVQVNNAARVVHHEPIHQVDPVHHVTKVVHHEPHHFLHYTNPVVDHHVVHENRHINEHQHAADLHTDELHHGDLLHNGGNAALVHHRTAALVHHVPTSYHTHRQQYRNTGAVIHKVVPSTYVSHDNYLAFAKQQLHGGYGKVKITEKHWGDSR